MAKNQMKDGNANIDNTKYAAAAAYIAMKYHMFKLDIW